MKNLAIIPARSGSKGLKDKNIMELNGKPLLYYSICAAKESGMFDEIMVSTDSIIYADIAKKCGASVPFLRSVERSTDNASSWGVVEEVLQNYLCNGVYFDTICLLQPTSPLRTAANIISGYQMLQEKHADAITSVCEVEHSPLWSMVLAENGSLNEFRKNMQNVPRQKLTTYHRLNGAIYIRKIQYKNGVELLDDNEYALIMKRSESVDIDTIEDFDMAQWYLSRNE